MKRIRIGEDNFKEFIDENGYFVDKSLLIKDVIDGGKVQLMPRPRRFGKTLNLSMLRYFFEKSDDDHDYLFNGLKIKQEKEYYQKQGQYPVIYFSLKDIKGNSWDEVKYCLIKAIASEYTRHAYIQGALESPIHQKEFRDIVSGKAHDAVLKTSLKELVTHLYQYHKLPVVILIDEYDSPIIEACSKGFYEEMIDFMRSWLGGGLKHETSQALFRAVVTGILRIAKESIFSGLNNLEDWTIMTPGPTADKFGFIESETKSLLENFNLQEKHSEVVKWYNGYSFGYKTIYNPWSVLSYVNKQPASAQAQWLNTSSNALIHEELDAGGLSLKRDLEKLLSGDEVRYPLNENIIFSDIKNNEANIWSFLYFSGYLKAEDPQEDEDSGKLLYALSIPNYEIREIYQQFVDRYFTDQLNQSNVYELLQFLKHDKYNDFEILLKELVAAIFSYHDTAKYPEAVYHAFMLGLLVNLRGSYIIKSNPETGYGRADIMMIPRKKGLTAKIIEFKSIARNDDINNKTAEALKQINEKAYATILKEAGISECDIRKLAIVIQGKQVNVTAV